MTGFVYVAVRFFIIFIDFALVAMLIRSILSWVLMGEENGFYNFLYVITEPLVMPIRSLCGAFGWFEGVPVDMPFLITGFALMLISTLLETLV